MKPSWMEAEQPKCSSVTSFSSTALLYLHEVIHDIIIQKSRLWWGGGPETFFTRFRRWMACQSFKSHDYDYGLALHRNIDPPNEWILLYQSFRSHQLLQDSILAIKSKLSEWKIGRDSVIKSTRISSSQDWVYGIIISAFWQVLNVNPFNTFTRGVFEVDLKDIFLCVHKMSARTFSTSPIKSREQWMN